MATAPNLRAPDAGHRQLSQKFYEKLGDDVANELVNWFNAVDATYRADLRDINELNFARFDARLEHVGIVGTALGVGALLLRP